MLVQPVHKGDYLFHTSVSTSVDFVDEMVDELCFCFHILFDLRSIGFV